jgi:hypothetical protein
LVAEDEEGRLTGDLSSRDADEAGTRRDVEHVEGRLADGRQSEAVSNLELDRVIARPIEACCREVHALARGLESSVFAEKPGRSLIAGLAGLILIPLIAILLLITVIGFPLAFITLALYVIALLLSGVFASWLAGGWLLERFGRPEASRWVRIVVGTLAVSVCVSLPWIGGLVWFAILISDLGALLLERRDFMLKHAH